MTKHILNNDSKTLQTLLSQLKELQQLSGLFSQHLEPSLAEHCQVSRIDKGCLIVIVDNGHWATQLRFQIPQLLAKLRSSPALQDLKGIICKVRPEYTPHSRNKKPRKVATVSNETAETILATAQTIKDRSVGEILEKIAFHLRTNTE